jgi:hypothetical protein
MFRSRERRYTACDGDRVTDDQYGAEEGSREGGKGKAWKGEGIVISIQYSWGMSSARLILHLGYLQPEGVI